MAFNCPPVSDNPTSECVIIGDILRPLQTLPTLWVNYFPSKFLVLIIQLADSGDGPLCWIKFILWWQMPLEIQSSGPLKIFGLVMKRNETAAHRFVTLLLWFPCLRQPARRSVRLWKFFFFFFLLLFFFLKRWILTVLAVTRFTHTTEIWKMGSRQWNGT